MPLEHGDTGRLSNEAAGILVVSIAEWLKNAKFHTIDGVTMCEDKDGLKEQAEEFIQLFAKQTSTAV